MKTQKSILNETPFKYKFADEDAKKSATLKRNADKLAALKVSIERGKLSC